jgi:hypothetical protein
VKSPHGMRRAYAKTKARLKVTGAAEARFRAQWRALGFDPPPSREEYRALLAYLVATCEVKREINDLLENGIAVLRGRPD